MIPYGFQRLALLNSAGYLRAELPLDAAVSLIAPNNTGKTSLINALQFLLIIDRRRMDFGAHDVDTSRRFYFPDNSAFILLEVMLPDTGTVVLGCVGKGVSHDYEYFAYKGGLDLDDFRLPDGSQLQQPALKTHLATRGKLVFSYSSKEFSDALYGARRKPNSTEPDIAVFRLEHSSQADVFQRVLTRTLRLDRLTSREVKDYLLAIFRRDLPDASIDFKAEWDKAFAAVNADRAQYDAAVRQKPMIELLASQQLRRLELRGKLLRARPLVDTALTQWQAHFEQSRQRLETEQAALENRQAQLQQEDRQTNNRVFQCEQELKRLQGEQARQDLLASKFALVANRQVLEERLQFVGDHYARQTALVQNASASSPDAIRRNIERAEREHRQLLAEQATLADNLYQRLQAQLPAAQLEVLNRVLSKPVMTLGEAGFRLDLPALTAWLAGQGAQLSLPGLLIETEGLHAQHSQRSAHAIAQRIAELDQELAELAQQQKAAEDLQAARAEQQRLQQQLRQCEAELAEFDEWQKLLAAQPERRQAQDAQKTEREQLHATLKRFEQAARELQANIKQIQSSHEKLHADHREIERLRSQRRDADPAFDVLADLPHQPWLGSLEISPANLAEALAAYHKECEELLRIERDQESRLVQLHAGGLTKFQFAGGSETEIQRIVDFAAHLTQEAQALERAARTAVVNVTACLHDLRDGLLSFKGRMREFNRLIGRRQLSDLSVFRIEPVDEDQLVSAIDQLISTAAQAESGQTFELFNQASMLDDAALNRAKSILIQAGEAHGCLRVEHCFRLEFQVGKAGREVESFADIDSAASNGTVLMAKLVTGLALLHLMQDKRREVQAVCYLDEASALDTRNQHSLVEAAREFGYALIFAAPTPLVTARYCVPITTRGGYNIISQKSWQVLEPLTSASATGAAA